MTINELTNIRAKDETTGKLYKIVGFSCTGDDRVGWNVNDLVLYDEDSRRVFRVNNPPELKRLSLVV